MHYYPRLICVNLYSGAGKSTLLQSASFPVITSKAGLTYTLISIYRYILTAKHGYRIAVIMNEFGDTADIEG